MSIVLAISGNIGSGKSTAGRYFESRGAIRIDADQLARDIVEPGTNAFTQIIAHFGEHILDAHGAIDRKKLGDIIFNNADQKVALEEITHPAIRIAMMQSIAAAQASNPPMIVIEIPLLFEGGMHKQFEHTLLIAADSEIRLRRVMARDQFSESDAKTRIDAQMPQEDKLSLASHVVWNNEDLQSLEQKLDTLWQSTVNGMI